MVRRQEDILGVKRPPFAHNRVVEVEEHGTHAVRFVSRRYGVDRLVRLDWHLLASAEYRALAQNAVGIEAIQARRITLTPAYEAADEVAPILARGVLTGGSRSSHEPASVAVL